MLIEADAAWRRRYRRRGRGRMQREAPALEMPAVRPPAPFPAAYAGSAPSGLVLPWRTHPGVAPRAIRQCTAPAFRSRDRAPAGMRPCPCPVVLSMSMVLDGGGGGRRKARCRSPKCERQASWGELACRYAERGGARQIRKREDREGIGTSSMLLISLYRKFGRERNESCTMKLQDLYLGADP